MSKTECTYRGDREGALIDYLYGELASPEEAEFDAHLDRCGICRFEIAELRASRLQLGGWQPPEMAKGPVASGAWGPPRGGWSDIPAWAQAAAAVLVLGVAIGAANLRVTYTSSGLVVQTGWMAQPRSDTPAQVSGVATAAVPWRAELEGLGRALRAEFQAAPPAAPARAPVARAQAPDEQTLIRHMRELIAESERQQQRELALRIAEVVQDLHGQRQADLAKIDHSLGVIQNNTGVEVMRQRQLINSLAVRVSQRQ